MHLVSIIIPCRTIDGMTGQCITRCQGLDFDHFEIIVLPDKPEAFEGVRVVPTGSGTPGKKRNVGASVAVGDILAYIDSDAYPRSDWLKAAIQHLEKDGIGAVGGPGMTCPDDGKFAQAQGRVLSSVFAGGYVPSRYRQSKPVEVDDIHSVNLVVWKKVVDDIGGWDEYYWPGEDELFCVKLRLAGYKQLLAPDVVVYHHRRASWRAYFRQISGYGTHRGFFVKRFPGTSRKLSYFLPAILVLGVISLSLLSVFFPYAIWVLLAGAAVYLVLILAFALRNLKTAPWVVLTIPLTHLAYGIGCIRGLLSRRLAR